MNILGIALLLFGSTYYAHGQPNQHFLSFVMPCYNCSKTVRKSIDSIYAQNISIPFEVVCTDDASKDDTLTILREYEKRYDNFHVFVHPHNKGGGAACNTCVKNSRGDLLFRLDSDNILAPNTIDQLVALLDSTGCEGATVQELRFFIGNLEHTSSWFYEGRDNICDLECLITKIANPAHSGNYLYTRKSFERAGGYPEKHGSDTFCFGFKQYATGTKIAILPNSFYWHYHNQDGYWSREEKTGANKKVALDVVSKFSEVFSKKTRKLLNKLNKQHGNIFDEIQNKRLELIEPQALAALFKAYKLDQDHHYIQAIKAYEETLNNGCESKKITRRLEQLKNHVKKALR
jgi:glycosyltransferase involved in cell wall biosynthesis